MRRCAAFLAVVLATPGPALGQTAQPSSAAQAPPAAAPAVPPADSAPADSDLARIKRRLGAETPLRDAATHAPVPTFRVAAYVRPRGGSWHHEFQDMVTPDEFKGYGGILGNGEKLQLAATSLAFAGAMKLLGMGVREAKQGLENRAKRKAREEVQQELEAFYALHPEARPAAPATPPP
jgi:hypothetical protein